MNNELTAELRKAFGDGIVFQLNEGKIMDIETVPTGIAKLDVALGSGVPKGRIIEIYGPESSGKSALASVIVGAFQKEGYDAVYIDVEYTFDPALAQKNGINIDTLYVSQPSDARTAMALMETIVRRAQTPTIMVLDSVAGLVTPAELEATPGSAVIGETARLMSQMMRKLAGATSIGNHVLVFTNQLRMKIGVMFGNPETTTGGRALPFWSTQRIQLLSRRKLGPKGEPTGIEVHGRVDKNKIAVPFKTFGYEIDWNDGINYISSTLDVACDHNIVRKSGRFFYYPPESEKYVAGSHDDMVTLLKGDDEMYREVYDQVIAQIG
jgi:recombination protein RecA